MPYSAEEIGARIKAAKPELKDFSDKDVGERILKAHPELGGQKTPLLGKGDDPSQWTSYQAKQRLSHLNPNADAAQPSVVGSALYAVGSALNEATGGFYGAIEKNIPMAAGMAATAAAGPVGSLATGALFASTKGLAEAATGNMKNPGQAAKDFVWDTVLVAMGDKTIRTAAKVGGELWNKFILNAAAKTDSGARILSQAEDSAHQAVQESVSTRKAVVDVSAPYRKFMDFIDSIPHGQGKVEHAYGGIEGPAKKLYEAVSADLGTVDAASGLPKPAEQPLDALVRYESKWMEAAWNAGSAGSKSEQTAVNAMKDFVDGVRDVIAKNLTPSERGMFEYAKGLTTARIQATVAHQVATTFTQGLIKGTLKDLYSIAGEPVVKKYAPVVLEQMLGSGPGLNLLKGLTSRVSNNPVALSEAVKQGATMLGRMIPVEIKDAIQRDVKMAADATRTQFDSIKEAPDAAPPRQK